MIKLIFDATVVTNFFKMNSARSGIFFAAYNILNTLMERTDIDVYLYISPDKFVEAKKLKKIVYPNAKFVLDLNKHNFLTTMNLFFWEKHSKYFSHTFFRKFFAIGIVFSQKILCFLAKREFQMDVFQNADVFFSPAFEIPKIVRKNSNLLACALLYDATPFLFKGYNVGGFNAINKLLKSSRTGDFFFFDSNSAKNDFEKIFPNIFDNNSAVVHLAANKVFKINKNVQSQNEINKKYNIPNGKKYIFSLCTLEPRKNLVRIAKTFVTFAQKNNLHDIVLVLGGGHWDDFKKIIEKEIEGFKSYSDLIIKAGYIDDDDLPILYSHAEWFVYTSQYEGFGLPPLEAMQCGCPVITSNNSSLPEVVGDAGIMIDWDSDEQHIEAYEKYYFNEKLRKENSQKGLERAKIFSWEKTVDKMVEVLKKRL